MQIINFIINIDRHENMPVGLRQVSPPHIHSISQSQLKDTHVQSDEKIN